MSARYFVLPGGTLSNEYPTIVDHQTRHTHRRPGYTFGDAELVAAWLNGHDQPLAKINMESWPGRLKHCRASVVTSIPTRLDEV